MKSKAIIKKIIIKHRRRSTYKDEASLMKRLELSHLTDDEIKKVNFLWGKIPMNIDTLYFKMFKTFSCFNERYCPDDLFFPYILRSLNRYEYALAFQHKGLIPSLFSGLIKIPNTIVNNINGVNFDADNNPISKEKAADILRQRDFFIIKPTVESCMGHGVRKASYNKTNFDSIFNEYKKNFIIQDVVKQSSITSIFNEPSLNTFRITTLYLNGVSSLCSIIFRCGQDNKCVDNGGQGGIMVGVNSNGDFADYGWNNKYKKFAKSSSGAIFKGYNNPKMQEMVCLALNLHEHKLPFIGIIGWDFALDSNNDIVLIEVNLYNPGIQFEQLCPQLPIFGDRTEEVIEYVLRNPPIHCILL